MKDISVGTQLDRAIMNFIEAKKELARVRELILLETSPFPGSRITLRERQVLFCVSRGLQNKEIAIELGCSVRTIKAHVSSMLAKTGLPDRVSLRERIYDEKTIEALSNIIPIHANSERTA